MKNLITLISKFKFLFLGCLLCSFLFAFDGILSPYVMGELSIRMEQGNLVSVVSLIVFLGLGLVGLLLAQLVYNFLKGKFLQGTSVFLRTAILQSSFQKKQLNLASTSFLTKSLSDVTVIQEKVINSFIQLCYCIFQGVISLAFVLSQNWKLGLVFIGFGILPTLVPKLSAKWIKNGTTTWQAKNQEYALSLEESLSSRWLLVRFRAIGNILSKNRELLSDMESSYFSMNFRQAVSSFFVSLLYNLSILVGFLYGVYLISTGELVFGVLLSVYMASDRVVTPLISAVYYINEMIGSLPLLESIQLNVTYDCSDDSVFISNVKIADSVLETENLAIGYDSTVLLKGLNLFIQQGEKVLVTGGSGTGKSTLFKTLLGEIPALDGTVRIGQEDKEENVYEHIAVIDQNSFVFTDTLRFNLTLGFPMEDSRLLEVLEQVGLEKFANLEMLNARVGKEDIQLSNGEQRRLEVARAILQRKEILFADEALSGLDKINAKLLCGILLNYPGTVLNIEHHIPEQMKAFYTQVIDLNDYC
ncbi:ATP-binding cassette domain-containing protein [Streptococcus suis]|uniref:Bacteriocin ABC exporter, ATP binding/permease n=1 Tax=Streptococcus suis TaxID=1307 RepID=A0A123SRE6_STRSU|nr:ABC transporter ATP-binding protein [Streptococcus suis]NQH94937.1 ABC transporter ATP-binding protein [Streptococcus suis]CYU47370.1 bacteriocin ABC exporter%2C ATP binding/permease [Streptococcus suis]